MADLQIKQPRLNLCSAGRLRCYKMTAVKILKTWRLKTTNSRAVYQDFKGNPTFEEGSNIPIEFIEGQTVQNKETLAESVGSELGAGMCMRAGSRLEPIAVRSAKKQPDRHRATRATLMRAGGAGRQRVDSTGTQNRWRDGCSSST